FLLLLDVLLRSAHFPYTTLSRSGLAEREAENRPDGFELARPVEVRIGLDQHVDRLFRMLLGVAPTAGRAAHEGHQRFRRLVDRLDRKSTRLNSSHVKISYAVFCL